MVRKIPSNSAEFSVWFSLTGRAVQCEGQEEGVCKITRALDIPKVRNVIQALLPGAKIMMLYTIVGRRKREEDNGGTITVVFVVFLFGFVKLAFSKTPAS